MSLTRIFCNACVESHSLASQFLALLKYPCPDNANCCRYKGQEEEAKIAAILTSHGFKDKTGDEVDSAVGLILDRTPFYAEQGGQVADIGRITSTSGIEYFEVHDTQVSDFSASFTQQCQNIGRV